MAHYTARILKAYRRMYEYPTILYTQLFFEPQKILNYAAHNLVK